MTYDNDTSGTIDSNSTLDNVELIKAINGVLSFKEFIVTDKPQSNITLEFGISLYTIGDSSVP